MRRGALTRRRVHELHTKLLAWYARRGYLPTGVTEPYPYGDDRYGRPLRDDLAFVILEKAIKFSFSLLERRKPTALRPAACWTRSRSASSGFP